MSAGGPLRKALGIAALTGLVVICVVVLDAGRTPESPSVPSADLRPSKQAFAEASARAPVAEPSSATGFERRTTERAPALSPSAAFQNYVDDLRGIAEPDSRHRFLEQRVGALEAMSEEQRRSYGVLDAKALNRPRAGEGTRSGRKLSAALLQHWVERAADIDAQSEATTERRALRKVAKRFFEQEARFGAGEVDPRMVELACFTFYFFRTEQDSYDVVPQLLDALRSVGREGAVEQRAVRPVTRCLANYARAHRWARGPALGVIEQPWLTKPWRASYVILLTTGSSFEEWSNELRELLAFGSDGARWGAIEAIRGFASASERGRGSFEPETLMSVLPPSLYSSEDAALRLAVLECVASFGGGLGEAKLRALLQDPRYEYRAELVTLLANAGALSVEDCLAYIEATLPGVRRAAIDALGMIVARDPSLLPALEALAARSLSAEDRTALVHAYRHLGMAAKDDLLRFAHEDPDTDVQVAAVRCLGRLPEPQGHALEQLATRTSLDPEVRSNAYQEWIVDAPNDEIPHLVDTMVRDKDPGIYAQGFVLSGAIAIATGDDRQLAEWRRLAVPSSLLSDAGLVGELVADTVAGEVAAWALEDTVRERLRTDVVTMMDQLQSPETREALDRHRQLAASMPEGGRSVLERQIALPARIVDYLAFRKP